MLHLNGKSTTKVQIYRTTQQPTALFEQKKNKAFLHEYVCLLFEPHPEKILSLGKHDQVRFKPGCSATEAS